MKITLSKTQAHRRGTGDSPTRCTPRRLAPAALPRQAQAPPGGRRLPIQTSGGARRAIYNSPSEIFVTGSSHALSIRPARLIRTRCASTVRRFHMQAPPSSRVFTPRSCAHFSLAAFWNSSQERRMSLFA